MYATPTLQNTAMHRFVVFHRARTLSFIHHHLSSLCFKKTRACREPSTKWVKPCRTRYIIAFVTACFTAVALVIVELVVIIAGTSVFTPITAASARFDPKLGTTTNAPRTRDVIPGCDDFFIHARGVRKAAAVLKCVSGESTETIGASAVDSLVLRTSVTDNTHIFSIRSTSSTIVTAVTLSMSIRTIGQGRLEVAPFRWNTRGGGIVQLLQVVAEGMLNRSLPTFAEQMAVHSKDVGVINFEFQDQEIFTAPHEQLASALVSQLRRMDVVLNSTSAPFVFVKGSTYERRPGIVISVMVSNRFPQGAVAILAVSLVLLRVLINSFFTSFDDVAYVVMKDIIRDDCVLGPLAGNARVASNVVPLDCVSCRSTLNFDTQDVP
ncbi:hypothetical protein FGB62_3g444 [Gracilaria domingensis]|nr:hypothetical protein FGB62_3g444 [Gracilaria domingensis]